MKTPGGGKQKTPRDIRNDFITYIATLLKDRVGEVGFLLAVSVN